MNNLFNDPLDLPIDTSDPTGNKLEYRTVPSYTGDRYTLQSDRTNMALYLPMGKTRDANDISGNGNDGTNTNSPVIDSAGITYNGTTQYTTCLLYTSDAADE